MHLDLPYIKSEITVDLSVETQCEYECTVASEGRKLKSFPRMKILILWPVSLHCFRGFHVGFNSLCAQASVNHLHFHTWYSEYSSYLETADMIPICEDLFEVIDYPTTIFVFELAPESSVSSIAKKIHLASTYLTKNEVAHNLHIMRGRRCLSHSYQNGYMQQDDKNSVLRVFLWPRNSVLGAKDLSSYESEKRPIAVYELAGSLAIETRPTYDSFTEEHFCGYLKRATLPEEEFTLHKNSIRVLLMKNQIWTD